MYDKTAIGKRIKELREKAGMSQDTLAKNLIIQESFADIYNSLSDKEKFALWHSVIDHIEFDMEGNIAEIFYIH